MKSKLTVVLAVVLLLAVLFVCIAPTIDLLPTVLLAARSAALMTVTIAAAAFAVFSFLTVHMFTLAQFVCFVPRRFETPAYILDCELLC